MEEIQKKTKKATASTTKGESKTAEKAVTKKTVTTNKVAKTAKTPITKKETKTSKVGNTKKETNTPKASTTKNETKVSKTKKIEEPKVEKIQGSKESKLTIVQKKKEQEVQENISAQKKQLKQKENTSTQKKQLKQEENTFVQKKQPKQKRDSEQNEEKKKKQKKNYIEISVGAIVCVAIIICLIILNVKLGTRAYNVITKNQTTNTEVETDSDISVTQEIGNVLNNSDKLVTQMKEKITFAPNVTASIYDAETFSTKTIPNDLKLILGWATTENVKKLRATKGKNQEIESIEKETMAENIKNVLGPNIKYKDESFNNTNISTFSTYSKNKGKINYESGIYTSIVSENIETGIAPLIYQEMQKVVKYTDKIIVYVKVAYMDTEEDKYIVYQNFSEGEFEERLLEVTPEELFQEETFNQYTGEGTVSINTNTSLDSIRSKLNTYKYTFSLDEETGEYYLTKFNKALSI